MARQVFDDPMALDEPDDTTDGIEERWQLLGSSTNGRLLFVVYTLRRGRDRKTRCRIISARKANSHEQARYNQDARRSR